MSSTARLTLDRDVPYEVRHVRTLPASVQRNVAATLRARGMSDDDVTRALDSRFCGLDLDSAILTLGDVQLVYLASEDWVPGAKGMMPLALRAVEVLPDTWGGLARPIATLSAFRSFLAAWRSHDPNGTWGTAWVPDDGSALIYQPSDVVFRQDCTFFLRHGEMPDGEPTFDLSGWVWRA